MTRSLPSFRILLRPSCPASKQPGLSTLPLGAVSSVLNALDNDSSDEKAGPVGAEALDRAGYESVSSLSLKGRSSLLS